MSDSGVPEAHVPDGRARRVPGPVVLLAILAVIAGWAGALQLFAGGPPGSGDPPGALVAPGPTPSATPSPSDNASPPTVPSPSTSASSPATTDPLPSATTSPGP